MTLCASLVLLASCDLGGGGGTNVPEPPPKPEYERAFDEFADVPNQIGAQVEWAAQPIDDAIHLADEIAALRTKLNIDAETFAGMCTIAFKDGTIEVGAVTEIEGAKAEVEATLAKIKQVGTDLQGIPTRVKKAGSGIQKLVMATPKLVMKSGQELTANLGVAVGDGKIQIQADIDTVKKLPEEVKAEAKEAKDLLTQLPDKAVAASKNLMAAMKGEPYTPLETTGSGEAADADADAGADAGAGAGTAVATADGETGTGTAVASGSTGSATPPPPPSSAAIKPAGAAPVEGPAAAPPAILAARIKQLEAEAAAVTKHDDWLSAAELLAEAYALAPNDISLAFKLGVASTRAKSCSEALLYFDRFIAEANPSEYPDKIQSAKKAVGELKTFDCPVRTAEDEAAVAVTLVGRAEDLGAEGDWGGAAIQYYKAYQRAQDDPTLAFEIGVASWKGHECSDAVDYFGHVLSVADPRQHSRQIRESNKYIDKAERGDCQPWSGTARDTHARDLYAQAQTRELALDYVGAAGKYERAYELLPDNHALSFRIAESYWGAQRCAEAEPHYRTFAANATDPRFADDLGKAQRILGRIASHGCPNALWNTAAGAPPSAGASSGSDSGSEPPVGGNEKPPESAKGGGGTVACSVGDGAPAGGLGFGLLMLAALVRRRRD